MINGMLKIALDKAAEISTVKKIAINDTQVSNKQFLTESEKDSIAERL